MSINVQLELDEQTEYSSRKTARASSLYFPPRKQLTRSALMHVCSGTKTCGCMVTLSYKVVHGELAFVGRCTGNVSVLQESLARTGYLCSEW